MTDMVTSQITAETPIEWRDRTWVPVTEACTPDELFFILRRQYFAYDSETARAMSTGGTFDVSSLAGTFKTYTIVNAQCGLVRMYRAADIRELRDGAPW